jgi:hypothetical protein
MIWLNCISSSVSGLVTSGPLWQYRHRKLQRGKKMTEQSFPGQSTNDVSIKPFIERLASDSM